MRIRAALLFFAVAWIAPLGAKATEKKDCNTATEERHELADPNRVEERISKLPPVALDFPSVREAWKSLVQELKELHPDFAEMAKLENSLMNGKLKPENVQSTVQYLGQKYAALAENLVDAKSQAMSRSDRRLIEGYRILMKRAQQLSARASYVQEHPEEVAPPEELLEDSPNPPAEHGEQSDPHEKADENEQPEQNEPVEEHQSEPQKQDHETQTRESKKQEKTDKKSQAEKAQEDPGKKESLDSPDAPKPDSKLEPEDQDSKEDKESQDPDQAEKAEKAEENGQSQSEKGQKSKEENQEQGQDSKQGKPKAQESSGQEGPSSEEAQDGKDSQNKEDQSQNSKKGKPSQGKSEKKSPKKDQEKSQEKAPEKLEEPSKSAGKEEGKHEIANKLSDYLKKMLEEYKEKHKSELEEKNKNTNASTQDPKTNQDRQTPDKLRDKIPPPLNDPKLQTQLPSLDDKAIAELAQRHLDALWLETLRQYENGSRLSMALHEFKLLCQKHALDNRRIHFLPQYAARAGAILEFLETTQVDYTKLENLALSMIPSPSLTEQNVLRKLLFLDRLFKEIEETGKITTQESAVQETVRELLSRVRAKTTTPTDKHVGEAFLSQLIGPLSRRTVKQDFSTTNDPEGMDWTRLRQSLKSSELRDLIIFGRLKPFTDVLLRQTMKPRDRKDFSGMRIPINEGDPTLELAEDLDRLPFFHRDGAPVDVDLLRLLSGDMLENVYRDEVIKMDPKRPRPRKVSILVYDISGSMKGDFATLTNSLVNAYLDRSQVDVVAGKEEHVVYMVPFGDDPGTPERAGSIAQAQNYFQRMRNHPHVSDSGTDITNALVKVYQMIREHQENGGELDRANILLITDGQDRIREKEILLERAKIDPKVPIHMSAITLGDENRDIKKLTENEKFGKSMLRHITKEEANSLLNAKTRLTALEESAAGFDQSADKDADPQLLVLLKQRVAGLMANRELDEQIGAVQSEQLLRVLRGSSPQAYDSGLQKIFLFYLDGMETALTEGWSRSRKASSLLRFAEIVARHYKISEQEILQRTDPSTKAKLMRFLGG